MAAAGGPDARLPAWRRTAARYMVPRIFASVWWYMRHGALVSRSSRVQLGGDITFGKGAVVKPYTIIQTSGGKVMFGHNCRISSFNHIAAGNADVIVGNDVRTGSHVAIIGTTREYGQRDRLIHKQGYKDKGITIGSDVLIGAHSVLVDGCVIGKGAVIGVGSVVTGKVEPYAIIFGAPAKQIFARR
ncbi:acyltransferase [Croceicoccus sp. F390]|uniref:Acyltransferase n=1 Tax=Croceicoccus esteveae TaxID=3075597 RepID=A0ABU2ZK37_9SPHN|nr:acyltransferase [Croceicoccus sp. F390]MDT0576968.1 acyltransferase [Croceicoccus sp. F390]